MASRNPFSQIRLVYRRSSLCMKILVFVTILVGIAALMGLRISLQNYQQQSKILQSQAAALQQENADLAKKVAELGTKNSIRRIAREELGLVDPNAKFFSPVE